MTKTFTLAALATVFATSSFAMTSDVKIESALKGFGIADEKVEALTSGQLQSIGNFLYSGEDSDQRREARAAVERALNG